MGGQEKLANGMNRNASTPIIGITVVVLLLFVSWLAYTNLFAPPKPVPLTPAQQQAMNTYDALAKKSHGDINSLASDERNQFMQTTRGYGAQILQSIAKQKGY
jgi:hypothetical protein